MIRRWDATMSTIPKGGDTIWGGRDWSPEEDYDPDERKHNNGTLSSGDKSDASQHSERKMVDYGRMISFDKDIAKAAPSEIKRIEFRAETFEMWMPNHSLLETLSPLTSFSSHEPPSLELFSTPVHALFFNREREHPGIQSVAYFNMQGQATHPAYYMQSHTGHPSFNEAATQSSQM